MSNMMNFKETTLFLDVLRKTGTNLVPCLLGHTGIGKTELVEQYAKARDMDCVVIHVAQLEPSDFIGLYKIDEDGRTSNCPPNWLPYKNAEEVNKSKNKDALTKLTKGVINPNGGIIFLDEVNRGHEDIRQSLYQLINKKEIHTYKLPENYTIAAAANPSSSYETYEFDKALVNRFAWVRFQPEADETLDYLKDKDNGKYKNSSILHWANSNKEVIDLGDDDFDLQEDMLFSPRMMENAMVIYNEIISENKVTKRKFLETLMRRDKVGAFLAYEEELEHIKFHEILQGKKAEKVKELLKDNRLDVLSTLVHHMSEYFNGYKFNPKGAGDKVIPKGKENEAVKNLVDFLLVIPAELNSVFIEGCKDVFNRKDSIFFQKHFRDKLVDRLKGFEEAMSQGRE